jgi:hypothetical protein
MTALSLRPAALTWREGLRSRSTTSANLEMARYRVPAYRMVPSASSAAWTSCMPTVKTLDPGCSTAVVGGGGWED